MFKVGDKVEYTARSGRTVVAWVLAIAGKTSVYLGPEDGFVDSAKPYRKSCRQLRLSK